jgi:hypothetical protein
LARTQKGHLLSFDGPFSRPVSDPESGARAPAPTRRRKFPGWMRALAGLAATGLIVGLIAWAPWSREPVPATPVGLVLTEATRTSVAFKWSSPSTGAVPTRYRIFNLGKVVATVPAATHSYRKAGLAPETYYAYTVVARAGNHNSAPSAPLTGSTLSPPLKSHDQVQITLTRAPAGSTGPALGVVSIVAWTFHPTCRLNYCWMRVKAWLPATFSASTPSASRRYFPFRAKLTGSTRRGYSGRVKGKYSRCGGILVTDTITVRIAVKPGWIAPGGGWLNWTGDVVIASPYTSLSGGYCPAQSWKFSLLG